ncbi:MAG: hypothetical protein E7200_14460 [Selenomonas ruminantium]|nr:hypothetical protein [Selenomonas ruminantium]
MNKPKKPQSMQELMTYYDNTIDLLQVDIDMLKKENARLQKIIDERSHAQTVSINDGIIVRGAEADLYPNEIREILIDVLKAARANIIKEGTRRADVVDDILNANPAEGAPSIRAKAIQAAFKGYVSMDASIRKKLSDLGITFPTKVSNHHKAIYYGDDRYKVSVSASCSDRRGGDNTAAEIIRKFL